MIIRKCKHISDINIIIANALKNYAKENGNTKIDNANQYEFIEVYRRDFVYTTYAKVEIATTIYFNGNENDIILRFDVLGYYNGYNYIDIEIEPIYYTPKTGDINKYKKEVNEILKLRTWIESGELE